MKLVTQSMHPVHLFGEEEAVRQLEDNGAEHRNGHQRCDHQADDAHEGLVVHWVFLPPVTGD